MHKNYGIVLLLVLLLIALYFEHPWMHACELQQVCRGSSFAMQLQSLRKVTNTVGCVFAWCYNAYACSTRGLEMRLFLIHYTHHSRWWGTLISKNGVFIQLGCSLRSSASSGGTPHDGCQWKQPGYMVHWRHFDTELLSYREGRWASFDFTGCQQSSHGNFLLFSTCFLSLFHLSSGFTELCSRARIHERWTQSTVVLRCHILLRSSYISQHKFPRDPRYLPCTVDCASLRTPMNACV